MSPLIGQLVGFLVAPLDPFGVNTITAGFLATGGLSRLGFVADTRYIGNLHSLRGFGINNSEHQAFCLMGRLD